MHLRIEKDACIQVNLALSFEVVQAALLHWPLCLGTVSRWVYQHVLTLWVFADDSSPDFAVAIRDGPFRTSPFHVSSFVQSVALFYGEITQNDFSYLQFAVLRFRGVVWNVSALPETCKPGSIPCSERSASWHRAQSDQSQMSLRWPMKCAFLRKYKKLMLSFVSLLRKTRLFLIEFQRNSFHLVCLSAHPDSLHAELVPLESDEVSTGAGILQHQTWEDLARLLGTSDRCPGIPGSLAVVTRSLNLRPSAQVKSFLPIYE